MASRAPDHDSSDEDPKGADPAPTEQAAFASDFGRYAGLGVQLAAAPLAFAALGWWIDGKLGTDPWLMLVGVFVGAAGGFYSIVRAVPKRSDRASKKRE